MAIGNQDISDALANYLVRHPEEAALLSEPLWSLSRGGDFASRRSFPVHVTADALLVRGTEILLVEHRAYGIFLQPGGHLDPADDTLVSAAERELVTATPLRTGPRHRAARIPRRSDRVRTRPLAPSHGVRVPGSPTDPQYQAGECSRISRTPRPRRRRRRVRNVTLSA
jgi:hypothetical protein